MSSVRIVFFGTPSFASNILEYLIEKNLNIVGIVTQPDDFQKRRGKPSRVKETAEKFLPKLKIFQPKKASDPEFIQKMRELEPDLFIVAAYGKILRQELLDVPKLGCINVHASLLPKYRGAAPIARAIMNGDAETGVTIMKMVLEMDAGDIIKTAKITISENMNALELENEMCKIAGPILIDAVNDYKNHQVKFIKQDNNLVTFAPKIENKDIYIDWNDDAKNIYNKIRALSPNIGARCFININNNKKQLKIFRAAIINKQLKVNECLINNDSIIVGCKKNALQLIEIQLEGKKKILSSQFITGLKSPISFL